ncbi:hypothetical protein K8T06_10265 [bacterium]|nr:hypothetical protein [bacterium]
MTNQISLNSLVKSSRIVCHETRRAAKEALRIIHLSNTRAELILSKAEKSAIQIRVRAKNEALDRCKTQAASIILSANIHRTQLESSSENDLVDLAIRIAETLIRTELLARPEIVLNKVREGLRSLRKQRSIKLLMHQDDADDFNTEISLLSENNTVFSEITIIVDSSLQRGDCVFVTQSGTVDLSLSEGLRIIRECLMQGEDSERRNS